MTNHIDGLPDRRAHRAKCAAATKPQEFEADDPTRQAKAPTGAYRAPFHSLMPNVLGLTRGVGS